MAFPAEAKIDGIGWRKAQVDELSVYSQTSDGKTREVVEDVVRFRAVLAKLGVGTAASPVPLRLFLFGSTRAYDPFKPAAMEKISTAGHFQASPFGHLLALNAYPDRGGAVPVVYHEYVHEYLHSHYSRLPVWLDEGLAEFYGTFRVEGNEAHLGLPQADEVRWLREHSFIPLARLFAIDQESPEYRKGEDRATYYAESWLLIHYMMVGIPEGGSQVGEFRAQLSKGVAVETAFRASFGMSFGDLEGKLRGYLNGRVMSYLRMPLAELPKVSTVALADVPPAQALYRLGMLLVRPGDADAMRLADATFEEALRLDAALGDAVVARATLAEADHREADAETFFDRVGKADFLDPASWYLVGRHLALKSERETGETASADRERARAALRQALAADPSYAEAAAVLGATFLADGPAHVSEGLPWLRKAAQALPGRPDLVALVARAEAVAGKPDHNAAASAAGGGGLVNQAAPESGREVRLRAVNEALAAGRVEEGVRLMREAVAAETPGNMKQMLQGQLDKLEAQAAKHREVEAYNRALAAAKGGRYSEARDALRELLKTAKTDRVIQAARRLLDDMDKRVPH